MVVEGAVIGGIAGVSGSAIVDKATESDAPIVRLLTDIHNELVIANRYSERQKTRTIYPRDMSPAVGVTTGIGATVQTDGAWRGHHIGFSGADAGDQMVLVMGSAAIVRWVASGGYMDIDLPLLMTPGTEMSIRNLTDLVDDTWRATLWYEYPQDDISHKYR